MRLYLPALLLTLALSAHAQRTFEVRLTEPAEVNAELDLASPGADWAVPGLEAAVADIWVDGVIRQQVMLYAGDLRHTYPVFLGELAPGTHTLRVTRNEKYSASGPGLTVQDVRFTEIPRRRPDYAVHAHAPVLYAREDTVGRFSDIPMVVYCERLREPGKEILQYTVVFSNEDGGTSTRALMARWGRTTDIEYVYKCFLDAKGECARATIQTKDHKEVEFNGERFGRHPVLAPVTLNNMVAANKTTALRYQIAPIEIVPGAHPRESVMDLRPVTWTVMAKELEREAKLRPYGKVEGEKVSDPRNYLYLDAKLKLTDAALDFLVRLKGEKLWRSSSLGRADYAIARDGWIRTTIELPPGASPEKIEEFGFACRVAPPARGQNSAAAGVCRVEQFGGAFLLNVHGQPARRLMPKATLRIPTGFTETIPAR